MPTATTPDTLRIIRASEPKGSTMTVVVAADRRELLEGKEAQALAKRFAISQGFSPRGLSDVPMTCPINEAGETTDAVAMGQEKIAGYATTFKFGAGIN